METTPQSSDKELFSLKTHYRDKEGRIIKTDIYRLHVIAGSKYFERPAGSFNFFFEDGNTIPVDKLPAELLRNNPNVPKPVQDSAKQAIKQRSFE